MSTWFATPIFLGNLVRHRPDRFVGSVPKLFLYWAATVIAGTGLTMTAVDFVHGWRTGFARTVPDVPDPVPRQPIDLSRITGLFGAVRAAPPPESVRMPANVFTSVTLAGVLWTGDPATSAAVLGHDGAMLLRRVGTGLDDGSLLVEIGSDYVVLARGSAEARLTMARQWNLAANPWANARARLGRLTAGMPNADVAERNHGADESSAPVAGLRADMFSPVIERPQPREVRRRQADAGDARRDPRFQQLRGHRPQPTDPPPER